ncbi:hypothetical protein FDP41_011592 [Naegleria fowleri]|uniref:DUF4116 domain-containing protein n=1 Tax=Naegleria fowleri TaxID=5763 RepID=A0A6A5C723_NAEFO|nr:uncharacterized protein FDP41_011592 [Naegleria fowleri]KAF0982662.1 hypothetical protein FDP41_011592 [Naegleria fowleri]
MKKVKIQCNPENFTKASTRLKNDRTFCLDVVRSNPDVFNRIPEEYQNDKEFIVELINTSRIVVDGKVREDIIHTCIPEIYQRIPLTVYDKLPMEIKK